MSLAQGFRPLGLAHQVKLTPDVPEGEPLKWTVALDPDDSVVKFRRDMEAMFAAGNAGTDPVL